MWQILCKAVIVIILIGTVLHFFGYPSLKKYQKRQTLISKSSVKFKEMKPPAITVVAWKQTEQRGWKNSHGQKNFESHCNLTRDFQEVKTCIDENTFDHNDVVEYVKNVDGRNITNQSFWTDDLSNFDAGKMHTLNNSYMIGDDTTWIRIDLNKSLNYTIFIHDPQFFMYTMNPDTIPQIQINLSGGYVYSVYIRAKYHSKIAKVTETQTCEDDKFYSFTACIKENMSKKVGCRLPWDKWTSRDISECSSVEQLQEFEKQYEEIDTWSIDRITKYLGCLPNCEYTEYQLAKAPIKYSSDKLGIYIALTSLDVAKMTEEIVYPVESFISEFGGALGLFLGFSLMMFWNWIEIMIKHLKKMFTIEC